MSLESSVVTSPEVSSCNSLFEDDSEVSNASDNSLRDERKMQARKKAIKKELKRKRESARRESAR